MPHITDIQLLGAVIAALGCIVLAIQVGVAMRAMASARWPTLDGSVVWAGTVSDEELRGDLMGGVPRRMAVYRAVVRYRYRIGDRTYTSDRLRLNRPLSEGESYAERLASSYKQGEHVTVYVSPQDPNLSVLEPGLQADHWVRLALAVAAVGIGLLLTVPQVGVVVSSLFN